ncbi:hypothetical protein DAEQUDRAFT_669706 [Daedalea quercina L-15889]|uniref:C2H2-type domain-containing protein n=1 Tax=Daedalea quercina L-15889 TaxID=1314783 RepID=A0A165QF52_9APHY|nr:hypothetical protein DAEQUDRAFT_669706 [Daedalea quercina L-15889]
MSYCDRCDRYFPHMRALEQHEQNSAAHNICYFCCKDFATSYQLKQHWAASPRHHYCQYCNEHFDSQCDLEEHYEEKHYYCSACRKIFNEALGLHEHNRQSHHYCPDCRRVFQSDSNLRSHLRSGVHASATIRCPGMNCSKLFVSGAALILHLESGTCPSRLTRQEVNRIAAKYDKNNVITNPSRMIGYREGGSAPTVTTWATERAWNGRAYECFMCHREFKALVSLNKHLASPAHEEKMYRCPRGYEGCGAEFSTLSALSQHVESERCGIRRFNNQIQNYLGDLTSNMKRLAM